jgi:CHAT domain-containing protein
MPATLSIEIAESVRSILDQFRGYTYLARIFFDREDFDKAAQNGMRAIDVSNEVRAQLRNPGLLREYVAVQQTAVDVLINANIRLGQLEDAWGIADQSRARRFRELLRESGIHRRELGPEDRLKFDSLERRLAILAEQRTAALVSGDIETAEIVGKEITPVLLQLEDYRDSTGQTDSISANRTEISVIQAELRSDDTLLEYHFSQFGSGLWQIRRDKIDYLPLTDEAEIEELANSLRSAINSRQKVSTVELKRLSELVFAEGAVSLDGAGRVVVVPDGSLQLIPFSILMSPARGFQQALVDMFDISYLPSASAMLTLAERDNTAGKGLAIIADPVFDFDDDRLQGAESPGGDTTLASLDPELRRSATFNVQGGFSRLYFSGRESAAIQASARDIPVFAATGTEASRDMVMNGALGDYEILHFATHGVLDMEEPALSGLVLSGVTARGEPRRRFLRTQDIATLELKADLVVLSGCDTGVGKLVRGEGLQSLSRAFFFAGAEQVVSSLWSVPDAATAELMGAFYRELLRNGRSAAQALRLAQLHVMSIERWESPYYWAAFIVQGRLTGN